MSGVRWERLAGIAGLVFVGLIVATFFTPSTPDIGVADASIAPEVAADWRGHALAVYLLGAAAIALVVFASGLWSRLRRAEGETAGASVVVIAGGLIFATLMLVQSGVTLALAGASREGRDAAAIRALFELDETIFIMSGFAFGLFLLGTAVSVLSTGALPRWLGWVGGVLGVGFFVALLGVMSADEEGGPLGMVYWVDLLLSMLWVLLTGLALLRNAVPRAASSRVPAARTA